jgi:hypothetical protein
MPLEQFKNNTLIVLDKFCPDYTIPLSFIEKNEILLENVLFMFYSVVFNDKYSMARFYFSLSFEESLTSEEILNKDFCGFSPNSVVVFNVDKEKAEKLSGIIKASPIYKKHYSECL